jgi:hypothetical protein
MKVMARESWCDPKAHKIRESEEHKRSKTYDQHLHQKVFVETYHTDHNILSIDAVDSSSLIFDKTYFSSLMFDIDSVCRRLRQLPPMRVQIIIPNLAPVNACLQESHAPAFSWCQLRRLQPLLRRPSRTAPPAAAGAAPGAAGATALQSAASAAAAEGDPGGAWAMGDDWFTMQCAHRNRVQYRVGATAAQAGFNKETPLLKNTKFDIEAQKLRYRIQISKEHV